MPIPERIKNAPALLLGLELYLAAWLDLSSEREIGWGEGPIPWSEVENYADRLELDEDEREELHFHIRQLDATYFKHLEHKRENA